MQITVAEQGAFRIEPAFSAEEARGRAVAHKTSAFGALSRLFSRPKDEDIELTEQGLRYDPLWHAKAHVRFVYDRRETYRIPVKTAHIKSVTIGTDEYAIDAVKNIGIDVPAVEHCVRDERKELWLDAVSNEAVNGQMYSKSVVAAVVLDTFAPEGAEIVTPSVRASGVVRSLLGDDFKPVDADKVHDESVEVECIDLYFRPMFAYKYTWAAKNKTAEVAIDGVTGEIRADASRAAAVVRKLLHPDTLFDVGAETLNLIIPGSAIAIRVAQALTDKRT